MNTQKTWPVLAGAVAVAVVLIAALWWAISGDRADTDQAVADGEPMDSITALPEHTDPKVAAQAALTQGYTWTPAEMQSDLDGFIASDAITERRRDELERAAAVQPDNALPSSWQGWARSGDVVRVIVEPEQATAGDNWATVVATVSQRVVHTDGEMTPFRQFGVRAEMEYDPTAEKWLLDTYEVTEAE